MVLVRESGFVEDVRTNHHVCSREVTLSLAETLFFLDVQDSVYLTVAIKHTQTSQTQWQHDG